MATTTGVLATDVKEVLINCYRVLGDVEIPAARKLLTTIENIFSHYGIAADLPKVGFGGRATGKDTGVGATNQ